MSETSPDSTSRAEPTGPQAHGDLLFIGSPGDLEIERDVVEEVAAALFADYHLGAPLRPYCYAKNLDQLTGTTGPQQEIQASLSRAKVVICMFGERLGTPLPVDFLGAPEEMPLTELEAPIVRGWHRDGQQDLGAIPLTGTVYEFLYGRARKRPVLVYLKGNPATVLDRSKPRHERALGNRAYYETLRSRYGSQLPDEVDAEYREQQRWLCRFIDEFVTRQSRATFHVFDTTESLKRMLRVHLRLALGYARPSIDTPGKGLAFYDREDAHEFHGRAGDVRRIVEWHMAALRAGQCRKLALIDGVSGVGKSSFVRAGLAAALFEGRGEVLRHVVCVVRAADLLAIDGMSPFVYLGLRFAEAVEEAHGRMPWSRADLERWEGGAGAGEEIVASLCRSISPYDGVPPTLLVLDQFEQLLSDVERADDGPFVIERWRPVLQVLRCLAAVPTGLSIVTVPDDWREALLQNARFAPVRALLGLDATVPRFNLGLPDPPRTRSIIEAFFRERAVTLSWDLANQITEEIEGAEGLRAGGASFLPLLSLVLTHLYEEWRRRMRRQESAPPSNPFAAPETASLDKETYGAVATIGRVINDLAEGVFVRFERQEGESDAEQALTSILRRLVWIDAKTGLRSLHSEKEDAFGDTQLILLRELERVRLAERAGGKWRLVHDAVVKHWDRTRTIHEQQGSDSILANKLEFLAGCWLDEGRREKYLLEEDWEFSFKGSLSLFRLPDVERLYGRWSELGSATREFVEASLHRVTTTRQAVDSTGAPRLVWIAHARAPALLRHYLGLFPEFVNEGVPETGETPLIAAAASGSAETVALLLGAGAKLEGTDNASMNALMHATSGGHIEVVRLLIEKGALLAEQAKDASRALELAAARGHVDVVVALLTHSPSLVQLPGRKGRTALIAAAGAGHVAVVDALLERGADPSLPDHTGVRALGMAASCGHLTVVRRLLDKAPHSVDEKDKHATTPLMVAAVEGHLDVIKLLLDRGADPALGNEHGATALGTAIRHGWSAIVNELLRRSPSLLTQSPAMGGPFMLLAAIEGHVEVAKALVAHGLDPSYEADGIQAIHVAASEGRSDFVEYLVDNSFAAVDTIDRQRRTPVMLAAEQGHLDMVRWLTVMGSNVFLRALDDRRAIDRAISGGHIATAQYLLESMMRKEDAADLIRSFVRFDSDGETSLSRARWKGDHERVKEIRKWMQSNRILEHTREPLVADRVVSSETEQLDAWKAMLGFSRGWELVEPSTLDGVLDALDRFEWEHDMPRTLKGNRILSSRRCGLLCYEHAILVEALCESVDTGRKRVRAFVLDSCSIECLVALGGSSAPIHWLNSHRGVRLATTEERASYVKFFCQYVLGEEGPFSIVESEADLALLQPLDPAFDGTAFAHLSEAESDTADVTKIEGLVCYDKALFRAEFRLRRDGSIEMFDDEPVARELVGRRRAQVDGSFEIVTSEGKMSLIVYLYLAIGLDAYEAVDRLVAKCTPEMIDDRVHGGDGPLDHAIRLNRLEIANRLIEVAPQLVEPAGTKREGALFTIAHIGNEHMLDLLLEPRIRDRIDLAHRNREGMLALEIAAANGYLGIVRRLVELDRSLLLPLPDKGQSVLMAAAAEGRGDVVAFLLLPGWRPYVGLAHRVPDGTHALDLAIRNGHWAVARMLLDADKSLARIPGREDQAIPEAQIAAAVNVSL